MAKVITFSRVFPKEHPKAGSPTHFVEQIYNSIYRDLHGDWSDALGDTKSYVVDLNEKIINSKQHTIRNGNRFKKGDFFSPRVWSGMPYKSKQIIIAPDLKIQNVYDIEIYPNYEIHINGVHFASFGSENCELLAKNDGLEMKDFINWFAKLPFKGQIICWSKFRYT